MLEKLHSHDYIGGEIALWEYSTTNEFIVKQKPYADKKFASYLEALKHYNYLVNIEEALKTFNITDEEWEHLPNFIQRILITAVRRGLTLDDILDWIKVKEKVM